MDQDSTPSAAELGISDAEYERIVRDLQRRRGVEPPVRPVEASTTARRSPSLSGWLSLLFVCSWALVRVLSGDDSDEGAAAEPAYAFIAMDGDQPIGFSSCRPIQVAVYPAGGPSDAEQLVREAVDRMRSATGLDIVVTGSYGGHAPNWNFDAAPITLLDPVSVSWQDGAAIADMTDDTAGLGGSAVVGRQRVGGTIALSRDYYAQLAERGDHDEALAVLLHEFGHVLGLDHVDSTGELMSAVNVGRTTLGEGDLEGLRRLGRGPCL